MTINELISFLKLRIKRLQYILDNDDLGLEYIEFLSGEIYGLKFTLDKLERIIK